MASIFTWLSLMANLLSFFNAMFAQGILNLAVFPVGLLAMRAPLKGNARYMHIYIYIYIYIYIFNRWI